MNDSSDKKYDVDDLEISFSKVNIDNNESKKEDNNESKKGTKCSIEGKKYEIDIYNIVKKCELNNKKFNTQLDEDLAGCGCGNDIECNFLEKNDIPIEIKKMKTPDWMQSSLIYNKELSKWQGSSKNKIPEKSKIIFEECINNIELFNGKIPPFMISPITHEEWIKIKKDTSDFNDVYIECSSDTIKKLYKEKGCYYIQISQKGLYHLGEDICGFDVPEFICEQHFRVRTKVHSKKDNKGFCKLSVTISCKPKNIKKLVESDYSLDDFRKLPKNLVFVEHLI